MEDERTKNLEIVVSELQKTIQNQEIDIENMKEIIIDMSSKIDKIKDRVKRWPYIEVTREKDEF